MATFDAYDIGVTRNPHHPKVGAVSDKDKRPFATNWHDLEFKVDGKDIPAEDVIGAFPHVQCVITLERDKDGEVIIADHEPVTGKVLGKVEIIGKPETCGCAMSKFKVPQWWNVELRGSN